MKTFARVALAGVTGVLVLMIAGGILLPLLGLAVGILSLAFKLTLVVLVGWLVLRALRGGERETA